VVLGGGQVLVSEVSQLLVRGGLVLDSIFIGTVQVLVSEIHL
jgi:hypothetical protein